MPVPARAQSSEAEASSSSSKPAVNVTSPSSDEPFPAMLVQASPGALHRHFDSCTPFDALAMVARPVGRREIASTSAAQVAMKKVWDALRALKAWDEAGFREWDDVRNEARTIGIKVHVGRVFGICVERALNSLSAALAASSRAGSCSRATTFAMRTATAPSSTTSDRRQQQ